MDFTISKNLEKYFFVARISFLEYDIQKISLPFDKRFIKHFAITEHMWFAAAQAKLMLFCTKSGEV